MRSVVTQILVAFFAGLVLLLIFSPGEIFEPEETNTSLITVPSDGASVIHTVQITGTYSITDADKDLWLIVQPVQSPQYHPQNSKITKQTTQNWKSVAYIGKSPAHNLGEEFIIHLVSASDSASSSIEEYLRESAKNKVWVGMNDLPPGTIVLHSIDVVRK